MSVYDKMPPKPKTKPTPAFNVREGRLPVLRHDKVMVGHVGPRATEATLGKFGIKHGGSIQKIQGRDCWVGNKPPSLTLAQTSAAGTNPAIPPPKIGGAA